jgi:hypothetical protein
MNALSIAIISMATAIVFTETVAPLYIKRLLKYNPFDYIKPWDCQFCMAHWFSILFCIIFAGTFTTGLTAWAITMLIAHVNEKLLNK